MEDIEKLKTENYELRNKLAILEREHYVKEEILRKTEQKNDQLLHIIENLSKGYVGKEDKR